MTNTCFRVLRVFRGKKSPHSKPANQPQLINA
jgi:hypothetical protein